MEHPSVGIVTATSQQKWNFMAIWCSTRWNLSPQWCHFLHADTSCELREIFKTLILGVQPPLYHFIQAILGHEKYSSCSVWQMANIKPESRYITINQHFSQLAPFGSCRNSCGWRLWSMDSLSWFRQIISGYKVRK